MVHIPMREHPNIIIDLNESLTVTSVRNSLELHLNSNQIPFVSLNIRKMGYNLSKLPFWYRVPVCLPVIIEVRKHLCIQLVSFPFGTQPPVSTKDRLQSIS